MANTNDRQRNNTNHRRSKSLGTCRSPIYFSVENPADAENFDVKAAEGIKGAYKKNHKDWYNPEDWTPIALLEGVDQAPFTGEDADFLAFFYPYEITFSSPAEKFGSLPLSPVTNKKTNRRRRCATTVTGKAPHRRTGGGRTPKMSHGIPTTTYPSVGSISPCQIYGVDGSYGTPPWAETAATGSVPSTFADPTIDGGRKTVCMLSRQHPRQRVLGVVAQQRGCPSSETAMSPAATNGVMTTEKAGGTSWLHKKVSTPRITKGFAGHRGWNAHPSSYQLHRARESGALFPELKHGQQKHNHENKDPLCRNHKENLKPRYCFHSDENAEPQYRYYH